MQTAQPFKRESNLSSRGLQQKPVFVANRLPQDEQLPECYFHRQNRITKFCECKECTLPLCSTCEEIHLEEHESRKVKAQISSYPVVRDRAMKELPQLIRRYRQVLKVLSQAKESVVQTISTQYEQLTQCINAYYECLLREVDSLLPSQQKLTEYQQRSEKISKGSIKSIIQHYSDSYPQLRAPKVNVNFSASATTNLLKSMLSLQADGKGKLSPPLHKEMPDNRRNSQASQSHISSGNDSKRLEYSPKIALTKSFGGVTNEEDNAQFTTPFERPPPEYISPIDKLTGEAKKQQQNSPFKAPPDAVFPGRKSTMDLLDPNVISKKKYEDFRDSFRRNNTLMMGNNSSVNRSNAASLEAKDWKKMITTLPTANQTTANLLTAAPSAPALPAGYQSLNPIRKETLLQPATDQHQRSPSFSTNPNNAAQKPKTNPSATSTLNPQGKQLTHDEINELISKREQLTKEMERTRNRSVDIKKSDLPVKNNPDLADRFPVGKPQQQGLVNRQQIERKDSEVIVDHPSNSAGRYLAQYASMKNEQVGPSSAVSSLINCSANQQQLEPPSTQSSFIRREQQQPYLKRFDSTNGQPAANSTNVQVIRSGRVKEQANKPSEVYEYRYVATNKPQQPPPANH